MPSGASVGGDASAGVATAATASLDQTENGG